MAAKLLFGDVEFDEKQTRAITEMIEGWKIIGKEELMKEVSNMNKEEFEEFLVKCNEV